MKRPQYVFRPNLNDPQHRRAWELLQQMPSARRKEQTDRLEKSIRKVVREELQVVTLTGAIPRTRATDIIPPSAINFLTSL